MERHDRHAKNIEILVNTVVAHLVDHTFVVLFAYVFASQVGAPLPAVPLMMAAGALTGSGRVSFASAMCAIAVACLCADSVRFALGRVGGAEVVRLLCRVSREPELWVRRTERAFGRHGARFALVAKFLPVLSLLAAPIAGQSNMRYLHFVAVDAIAAVAWAAAHVLLGRLLGGGPAKSPRIGRPGGVTGCPFRRWRGGRVARASSDARA
jgi:membrane protein DedA with SNARE-associated domain